jgi:RNA polymerase sigma factor (sigma-70 family)
MKENFIDEFYRTYYLKFMEYAKTFVSETEAQDLVQDLFMNLLCGKICPKKIGTPDELKRYMYVCLEHLCIDKIRHNKVENDAINKLQIEYIEFAEQRYMQKNIMELILIELDKQPEIYKEIIFAHYSEELSAKEIAECYNLSTRTVESYLYRTLAYLKKRLKHD